MEGGVGPCNQEDEEMIADNTHAPTRADLQATSSCGSLRDEMASQLLSFLFFFATPRREKREMYMLMLFMFCLVAGGSFVTLPQSAILSISTLLQKSSYKHSPPNPLLYANILIQAQSLQNLAAFSARKSALFLSGDLFYKTHKTRLLCY